MCMLVEGEGPAQFKEPLMHLVAHDQTGKKVRDTVSDRKFSRDAPVNTYGGIRAWDFSSGWIDLEGRPASQFTIGGQYTTCTWIMWKGDGMRTVWRGNEDHTIFIPNNNDELGFYS